MYKLEKWSEEIFNYQNFNSFKEDFKFINGLHHFEDEPLMLDLLLKNFDKKSSYILVCFNAAISARNEKEAPFFSGVNLSEDLQIPLIAISDPTVSLSNHIGLAWYAGSKLNPNLQKNISDILDHIKDMTDKELILLGGSGGGFAALAISQLMSHKPIVLAMNPQTSIEGYDRKIVIDYINQSFNLDLDGSIEKEDIGLLLDKLNIFHNVNYLKTIKKINILQNRSDWHYKEHLTPFIKYNNFDVIKDDYFYRIKDDSMILVGNWGDNHVSPPPFLIKNIIRNIVGNIGNENYNIYFDYVSAVVEYNSYILEDKILIETKNVFDDTFNYCFIIYEDNEVVFKTPYRKNRKLTLEYKISKDKNYKVRCFIRDVIGNRKAKTITI